MDRIAEQSGVNKNLIYHYFGSKDALYLAVLERIYADCAAVSRIRTARLPPVEGMAAGRQYIRSFRRHARSDPPDEHGEHSLRKALEEFAHPSRCSMSALLDTIRMLLQRGQAEGVFRSNVDAVDLYMSISGLAYFYLSNRHTLSWLFDRDLDDAPAPAETPSARGRAMVPPLI